MPGFVHTQPDLPWRSTVPTMPATMIFDGDCVLCSGTVQFVLRHERDETMSFATTQSAAGRELAERNGVSVADLDLTFVLVEDGQVWRRSDAAVRVARHLATPWRWLAVLRLVPRPLRDLAYSAIARRRYRLFGRREACFLPAPSQRRRFLPDRPPDA